MKRLIPKSTVYAFIIWAILFGFMLGEVVKGINKLEDDGIFKFLSSSQNKGDAFDYTK